MYYLQLLLGVLKRFVSAPKVTKQPEVTQEVVKKEDLIQWESLPEWAKNYIKEAGALSTVNIHSRGSSLNIQHGVAFFNGKRVVRPGEVVKPFDVRIKFADLPEWAKKEINKHRGGITQIAGLTGSLQISGNTIYYNGVLVINEDK